MDSPQPRQDIVPNFISIWYSNYVVKRKCKRQLQSPGAPLLCLKSLFGSFRSLMISCVDPSCTEEEFQVYKGRLQFGAGSNELEFAAVEGHPKYTWWLWQIMIACRFFSMQLWKLIDIEIAKIDRFRRSFVESESSRQDIDAGGMRSET